MLSVAQHLCVVSSMPPPSSVDVAVTVLERRCQTPGMSQELLWPCPWSSVPRPHLP